MQWTYPFVRTEKVWCADFNIDIKSTSVWLFSQDFIADDNRIHWASPSNFFHVDIT